MNGQDRRNDFLFELYGQVQDSAEGQVSMHEVGEAIGLEREEAGSMAEDLIVEELVELRTLSGGIGMTEKGQDLLRELGMVQGGGDRPQLSGEPLLTQDDHAVIGEILDEIKRDFSGNGGAYQDNEEIVMDIKTIEVQLLSSSAKTAIVKEVFRSLQEALRKVGLKERAENLDALL